jgi:hypothetical protein
MFPSNYFTNEQLSLYCHPLLPYFMVPTCRKPGGLPASATNSLNMLHGFQVTTRNIPAQHSTDVYHSLLLCSLWWHSLTALLFSTNSLSFFQLSLTASSFSQLPPTISFKTRATLF